MDKVSTHQKMIVVKPADIDELDHVNNVVYLSWVQDIAKEHWQIRASQEIINQYKWVVVNHNITYKKPLKIHQKAFIKTLSFLSYPFSTAILSILFMVCVRRVFFINSLF